MKSNQELSTTSTFIALDAVLVSELQATLTAVKLELVKLADRERQAVQEADANRLLNEAEAMDYLRRDADTLQYYRRFGLNSYKQGRDRWYRKGDIDAWLESGKVTRRLN